MKAKARQIGTVTVVDLSGKDRSVGGDDSIRDF